MSRIHEALKKAAEEKNRHGASEPSADLVDIHSDRIPARTGPSRGTLIEPPAESDIRNISYEELISRCAHPTWQIDARMSAFQGEGPGKIGAERFRTLRSRLHQISVTRPLKKVLITSSLPAEGKTFVAANLAQSIVRQEDRHVLLMDVDLRASRLHTLLGAPSSPGLADYLLGKADEFSVIQKGMAENLCFIPGGSEVPNPSELLLGDRMKELLEKVSAVFDWVILDSPPTLPVHDASILADLCDGTLFVVRAGVTDYEVAARAAAEFESKNLLGVVLNGTEDDARYGGYYYGYGSQEKRDL
jgi:capsular exopolysaccharide synthesis family protein